MSAACFGRVLARRPWAASIRERPRFQPAAVFGSEDELKAVPQGLGLSRRVGLVQCAGAVRVQVVHHQSDPDGARVSIGDVGEQACPVGLGSALRHLGHALAGQRFRGHEHVAGSAAPVFVVVPGWPARFGGARLSRLAAQLAGCLVHAYHRKGRSEGTAIHIEHLLHRGREIRVALRWEHPPDPLPRLEGVFFRTRRTVSCDTLSMWPSSTARSASSRSDHCAWPSGGSAQLKGISEKRPKNGTMELSSIRVKK